ncbi:MULTISPECIES: aldo/keto reductase [unclassified Mesorhizobium]|uniref:aldo/keto reductase n=1 Tax=unclassified Mesorhizobium TaxID=325217 RepID=UPI001128ABAC|nr:MULTISPECIES: aldo/keto reductase [unclassified Mesorhizobium]MBZ9960015.1 aldo/keto reductase [Mesorhizobium sp. BR1-1-14]TPK56548.1 aldo/keto reductase [Mesorhizobium sp. B2-5-2]TPL28254.1 aldo/keto reductase [Mesorhizobium sp. B2-4-9]TPL29778.1 aldo/keto reductase [Mesorhizobium sp. B2-4-7]TPL44097.1 aldo/keto reductase [Mesorhizobium sp. B2-4-5]
MEYRTLGRSGLKVSALTMGTMTFGGAGPFAAVGNSDLAEAKRMIDLCIDAGINLIDTANVYSDGLSEEIIGEALGGKRRNDVLIASKARMRIGDGPNDEGLSRHHLIRECEKSLKRLKTDVIDIYFLHEWDGVTPLEETIAALDTLVGQGKIRYVGCSNYSGWQVMKALSISDSRHQPRFVTQQIHYTLEAREAEYELLPISVDQGLGVLVWSPLAGGLLSGKYHRDNPTARQVAGWSEPPIRDEDRLWRIVDVLVEIGKARGVSAAQVALAWLLGRPAISSLVIGGRNEAQFRDNIAAASLTLAGEERDRLDAVSRPPLLYPYWHQQLTAKERFGAADLVIDRSSL